MAARVDMKVMVIDKLMSPWNIKVQKLEPVPPGEQPKVNKPSRCRGSSNKTLPTQKEN